MVGALALCAVTRADSAFIDPLDAPALKIPAPAGQPLLAVARAGDHLVAVGARGVIIYSAGNGAWLQADVPVQSDLVDVKFADPNDGWACGHDGVILHSTDGGKTWVKQLDGIAAQRIFESYYNQQIHAGDKALASDLAQVQLNYDNGPILPWLSISIDQAGAGYAVGSFGDIAMTSDGGKTWKPWLEYIDNPDFLDLNAVDTFDGQTYIAGEQGRVYFLDKTRHNGQGEFVQRPTGYAGMLFGVTGSRDAVVAFGMNGHIFRSEDQGRTWTTVVSPDQSSLSNGTVLPDGTFVLAGVDGSVIVSHDGGKSFTLGGTNIGAPLTGLAALSTSEILLTSLAGFRQVSLH